MDVLKIKRIIELIRKEIDLQPYIGGARKLTEPETALLKNLFGTAVSYDEVKIKKGVLDAFSNNVVTLYNIIFYPEIYYQDDFSNNANNMALLAHEITHVWQHQCPDFQYSWINAALEHILYKKEEVYQYNLEPGKTLLDYRFEQQGKIIQHYYAGKINQDIDIPLYESIIYASIIKY